MAWIIVFGFIAMVPWATILKGHIPVEIQATLVIIQCVGLGVYATLLIRRLRKSHREHEKLIKDIDDAVKKHLLPVEMEYINTPNPIYEKIKEMRK